VKSRRSTHLLVGLVSGLLAVFTLHEGCSNHAPDEQAQVGTDGGADRDAKIDRVPPPEAGGAADGGSCEGTSIPPPPGTPNGWTRAPCIPSSCQVVIAPDAAHAHPGPSWTSCGKGCLQVLATTSINPWHGIRNVLGAAKDGARYLSLTIEDGSHKPETQIVRVSDNTVIFDAVMLGGNENCSAYVNALSPERALFEIFYQLGTSSSDRELFYSVDLHDASPRLSFSQTSAAGFERLTVSSHLWAATPGFNRSLLWHPFAYSESLDTAWQSPDGRVITHLASSESTVFLSTELFETSSGYELLAWDAVEGPRPLAGSGSVTSGDSACCALTDGKMLTWLRGSSAGWQPDRAEFTDVVLMASPLATHAVELRPRKLRSAYQNNLGGVEGAIGGGYVLIAESRRWPGHPVVTKLVLTRISDGAFIILPDAPGLRWRLPFYVDETEFAVLQGAVPDGSGEGKLDSIVRQTIADLGPFHPADAWSSVVHPDDAGTETQDGGIGDSSADR
jgi:hypothetical protein